MCIEMVNKIISPAMRRLWAVALCLAAVAQAVCAVEWEGPYYREGEPGTAVEFSGKTYTLHPQRVFSLRKNDWQQSNEWRRIEMGSGRPFELKTVGDDNLLDQTGTRWVRQPPVWTLSTQKHFPLTLEVVEKGSDAPIKEFSFWYQLRAPGGLERPPWVGLKTVKSKDGCVVIDAPASCMLSLQIEAKGYRCHDYTVIKRELGVRSEMTDRRIVVELERGYTVDGRLVDAETGAPVTNALVMPLINYDPGIRNFKGDPDFDLLYYSDSNGMFTAYAIHSAVGLWVERDGYGHDRYNVIDDLAPVGGDPMHVQGTIKLKPVKKCHVKGTVSSSASGKPIEGVKIRSYDETTSREDGSFAIDIKAGTLWFMHPQYAETKVDIAADKDGLDVVMNPLPVVSGQVVDAQGEPVTNFTVVYRTRNYFGRGDIKHCSDPEGRFELMVAEPTNNICAVNAEGYAMAQAPFQANASGFAGPIVLNRGVSVSGRIKAPAGHGDGITVRMVPQREGRYWRDLDEGSAWNSGEGYWITDELGGTEAVALGARTGNVEQDGSFRVDCLSAGSYTLIVSGAGINPFVRTVRVPAAGRQLRDTAVEVLAGGTIKGRTYYATTHCLGLGDSYVAPFFEGEIHHTALQQGESEAFHGIEFVSDEDGYYCVTNLPPGRYELGDYFYRRLGGPLAECLLKSGEVKEIDIDPNKRGNDRPAETGAVSELTISVEIGDGSEEAMRAALGEDFLTEEKRESDSPWRIIMYNMDEGRIRAQAGGEEEVARTNNFTIKQKVYSGTKCISLNGRFLGRDRNHKCAPIEAPNGSNTTVRLQLSANSLSGTIHGGQGIWTKVYVLDEESGVYSEDSYLRDPAAFLEPFMPEGRYTVFARNEEHGVAMCTGVTVRGAVNFGEMTLSNGVRVAVQLLGDWVEPRFKSEYRIDLTHLGTGIKLTETPDSGVNGGTCLFPNVWPGEWKAELRIHDRTLCATNLVAADKPVAVDLVWTEE